MPCPRPNAPWRLGVVIALGALAAACGENGATPPPDAGAGPSGADAATEAGLITCQNDPRADAFQPPLAKAGKSALYKFVLVSGDPAPPGRGTNTWTLRIEDSAGAPVTGATLKVTPTMPDHGHGTSIRATVVPEGDAYKVTPLYFFMPGLWQVTFEAAIGDAAPADSAVFSFCVPG